MLRGTTPYHVFPIPIPVSLVEKLYITYSQYDEVLFEKTLEDCEVIGRSQVRVHLSQEDTMLFSECEHSHKVEVQVTTLSKSGERYTNDIVKLTVGKILKEGILSFGDESDPVEPLPISHTDLSDREKPNQHPIYAITGLEEELNNKVNISESANVTSGNIAVFSERGAIDCCSHSVDDFFLKENAPEITDKDEGKFLTVKNGKAVWTELPVYDGSCVITPDPYKVQSLRTSQSYIDADIVIQKIPYAEVSNDSNGKTITIG